jgi:hypothetical protein
MNTGRRWLLGAVLAIVAIVGLLIAGSQPIWTRDFALRSPSQEPVAQLSRSQRVCEGPVTSPHKIEGVGIWGGSTTGVSTVTVQVQSADGRNTLTSGSIRAPSPGEYIARLAHPVASGMPVRVCVTGALNTFSLLGSAARDSSVVMAGPNHSVWFSLVLLDDDRSLLSSLSTAFSRASLWRPSWVGSWVYWLLAVALVASFGFAVAAVAAASTDDGDDAPGEGPNGPDGSPPSVRWRPGASADPGSEKPAPPTQAVRGRG